jgi:SRSO17 transposase
VARQYSGTAGRIENAQIGVFLGYATPAGRTLVDRELYLPQAWTEDRDRCTQAGVPDGVGFATKPELAIRMLTRALDAGVPAGWVTADEVYGQHRGLRQFLEQRRVPYVLAIPSNHRLWADLDDGPQQLRADRLAAALPAQAWKRISAGAGAKAPAATGGPAPRSARCTARRPVLAAGAAQPHRPGRLASYACSGPAGTPLCELVRVAGARWAIEECFQSAKGETGLDQYQVRRYDSWYRHITLAMFAHAFLTATRAAAAKKGHSFPPAS